MNIINEKKYIIIASIISIVLLVVGSILIYYGSTKKIDETDRNTKYNDEKSKKSLYLGGAILFLIGVFIGVPTGLSAYGKYKTNNPF
jgi:NADH:ubiquinone oxidoreductase subunit 2 (subunit N)